MLIESRRGRNRLRKVTHKFIWRVWKVIIRNILVPKAGEEPQDG